MRLLSSDGAAVELGIARYQFPDLRGHGDRDWDANWLQIVEAGRLLFFTEPNLAFSLAERIAEHVRLRVHFSLEALPPWLSGAEQPDVFDFFVELEVPTAQVEIAAADWAAALSRFPQR